MENRDVPAAATRVHDRLTLAMVGTSALVLSASLWISAPEPPEPGASADRIRSFIEGNLHQTTLAVVAATIGFGTLILLTVGLWRLVASAGCGQSFPAVTLLISGSLSALWLGVVGAVNLVPVVAANDAGKLSAYSDQTLLTLDLVERLGETFGDVSTVPRGFFLVSAGLLIVRHRILPRWTGYVALVVGAVSVIGIVLVGIFGFVLWVLIVGVASIVMLVAQWRKSRAETR